MTLQKVFVGTKEYRVIREEGVHQWNVVSVEYEGGQELLVQEKSCMVESDEAAVDMFWQHILLEE